VISFELTEEQQLIQDTARKFASEKLWPRIRDTEAARELPGALIREAHELGLRSGDLPEDVGGHGLPLVTACLVEEQLAFGDAAACYALGGAGALGSFVRELGTPAQQQAVLSRFAAHEGAGRRGAVAWSEAKPAPREGFATTARHEGSSWLIHGEKAFVVNGGVADHYVVVAQIDESKGWSGLGAFLVEGNAKGVIAGPRRHTVGLDAAYLSDVKFDGVRVSDEARLAGGDQFEAALLRAFLRQALKTAARAVGLGARAWQLTRDYCEERKAFGKPIGHFQAVAFTVADRLMDVDGARWLVWRAAAGWDKDGAPRISDVASAAAHALEVVMRAADDAVQLFGGAGFIRDYPVEKCFRDARQLSLMTTTVTVLDQLHADHELGRPLDPAVVLPTPDIQPVCI